MRWLHRKQWAMGHCKRGYGHQQRRRTRRSVGNWKQESQWKWKSSVQTNTRYYDFRTIRSTSVTNLTWIVSILCPHFYQRTIYTTSYACTCIRTAKRKIAKLQNCFRRSLCKKNTFDAVGGQTNIANFPAGSTESNMSTEELLLPWNFTGWKSSWGNVYLFRVPAVLGDGRRELADLQIWALCTMY